MNKRFNFKFATGLVVILVLLTSTMQYCSGQKSNDGFIKVFDGKTFTGWRADKTFWRVENGEFIGEVTAAHPIKTNTFLIYDKPLADFEFKAEYKLTPEANSGVNYRSEDVEGVPFGLKGYQADIDGANVYTGQNYEERGRGFLAMRGQKVVLKDGKEPEVTGSLGSSDSLKAFIKDGWNEVHIVVKGNHMMHYINGVLMSEATDEDASKSKASGWLGLQVHVMPKMKVEYRNIRLKVL